MDRGCGRQVASEPGLVEIELVARHLVAFVEAVDREVAMVAGLGRLEIEDVVVLEVNAVFARPVVLSDSGPAPAVASAALETAAVVVAGSALVSAVAAEVLAAAEAAAEVPERYPHQAYLSNPGSACPCPELAV